MSSKAKELKNINCSICGAPLWTITGYDEDLVEYACLNGHVFTYKDPKPKLDK
jgi:hypothetical protein